MSNGLSVARAAMPESAPPAWTMMSRAELDAAYDNTGAVAESAAFLADWSARSAALRARQPALLDLAYGPAPRNRTDIFRSGHDNAPLLVFIHGGYWQRNSKEIFSCLAEGPLAHGVDVALPGYTLAPEATLTDIVGEIEQAISHLRREGPELGVARGKLIVSGWSAGGHLTACAMTLPGVDAGIAISGIFDLAPIGPGVLNDKLRLTQQEIEDLSPIRHLPRARALSDQLESADRSEFAQNKESWGVLRSNLISKRPREFSSEVDTGSREENALNQTTGAFPRFEGRRKASSGPLIATYGLDELPELQRQSRDYAQARANAGLIGMARLSSALRPIAGANHFSILEHLARADGAITAMVRELAG